MVGQPDESMGDVQVSGRRSGGQGLVLITGASSGIGLALALHYASLGWQLALVARRGFEIKSAFTAHHISDLCYQIYECDVADALAMRQVGQRVLATQGVPDVVVANAGISVGMDTAVHTDLDVMHRTLQTNVLGLATTFHPFLATMVQRHSGTLVVVASVAGIRGLPGHGAYCASKAAAIAYAESLRGELRPSGVRVVTLLPGYVDTPLTRRNRYAMPFLMSSEAFAREAARAIAQQVPYRVIPWPMRPVVSLLRWIPIAWFDRLLAGRPRKRREGE